MGVDFYSSIVKFDYFFLNRTSILKIVLQSQFPAGLEIETSYLFLNLCFLFCLAKVFTNSYGNGSYVSDSEKDDDIQDKYRRV